MLKRKLLGTTGVAALMAVGGAGAALAQQAVAYPNASLGGFGGTWQSNPLGLGEGRITVPLGGAFGAQADGFVGTVGGASYWQVAGHLFWRAPSAGLVGAYVADTHQQGVSTLRVGSEAEIYFAGWTLSGVGGWKFVSGNSTGGFLQVKATLYATPDTSFFAGYIFDGSSFANIGFEHRFTGTQFALFGEGRFGNAASGGWIGLRAYLGGSPTKSLLARDREDVAPLWLHLTAQTTAHETTVGPGTTSPPTTAPLTTPPPTTPPPTTPPPTTPPPTTPPPPPG